VDGNAYDARSGLRLPPHVRTLVIDYTALSLVTPERIHFRFKLEGQDPNCRKGLAVQHYVNGNQTLLCAQRSPAYCVFEEEDSVNRSVT
jgi:hypothetical protein